VAEQTDVLPTAAPQSADVPTATTAESPTPVTATPPRSAAPAPDETPWAWIAGGIAFALLLLGGLLRLRRRRPDQAHEATARPAEPRPEPGSPAKLDSTATQDPSATASAPSVPTPEPVALSLTPASGHARPLEIGFEARHLSRAMVNASLAYRLTLTNNAATAQGPLRIAGDIISAHGSLSSQDQLTPPSEALPAIHEVPGLAPGKSLTLSGELRLPLASILPMQSGGARVFVPLARFRIESDAGTTETHVVVVGQASERPGGALRPFPLDRGPGVDRGLGQRELGLPA
jgi:hypothetical protein